MRKIKFRAWDKKRKKMCDVVNLQRIYADESMQPIWVGSLHKHPQPPTVQCGIPKDEEKNFVLMQYTGLRDKNGKEIYEGDIVFEEVLGTHVVEWDDEATGYSVFFMNDAEDWKVVGNIYENPELLEKKEEDEDETNYI